MNNKIELQEWFKKILDIQKVFIQAKNDNWETFIKEIKKLDKAVLEKQLKYYWENAEKVNKLRVDIIKLLLEWKEVDFDIIDKLKEQEQKKYSKNIFRSWTYFWILHSIYYFDKRKSIREFLNSLNNQLVKDLNLEWKIKINIVDFTWAQNFWLDGFWTAIYNKTHKSQRTALQLCITPFDEEKQIPFSDYKLSIWLWKWPEANQNINRNFIIVDLDDLTYNLILEICERNKQYILEDIYDNTLKTNLTQPMQTENTKKLIVNSKNLLNLKKQIILFWPPWTWKTYNVKNIIEKHSGEDFGKLKQDWKVEFITFHQSFSYEEFIEGIRAETDGWQISYKVKPWIFKKIVERAEEKEITNFDDAYSKLLKDIDNIEDWILILETKTWKEFWISINSNWNLKLYTWKEKKEQWVLTKDNIKA